jgi:hypothetical protein
MGAARNARQGDPVSSVAGEKIGIANQLLLTDFITPLGDEPVAGGVFLWLGMKRPRRGQPRRL